MRRWTCLLLLATAASITQAGELSRNDFAYSMRLQADGTAALYETPLPLEVYRQSVSARLQDIRVLNARGEVLPYAIVARAPAGASIPSTAAVPLFPLWGESAQVAPGVNLNIHTATARIQMNSATVAGSGGIPAQRRRGFLLDTRAVRMPVVGIEIDWRADAAEFSELVTVQASDDLAHWRDVVVAPLVNLRFNGEHLYQNRIGFTAGAAQFWRLMWPRERDAVAAFAARVLIAPAVPAQPHQELRVTAVADAGSPGTYLAEVDAHVPADQVNVLLPERNSVTQFKMESRDRSAEGWRTVTSATFYRLANGAAAELRNPGVGIAENRDRHWKLSLPAGAAGIGTGMPTLVVSWVPEMLRFIARGPGPYELVFGSAVARSAASPNSLNIPSPSDGQPIRAVMVATGPMLEAGGPAKRLPPAPPLPWKTWTLWAVLIAGVLLLSGVALRLNRELNRRGTDSA